MVQLLVSRGANVNTFDKKDRRAVHWAAYMGETSTLTPGSTENMFPSALTLSPSLSVAGHLEVMRFLVSHGAEVCCKDNKSYSPLHAAASSGMINVVKYLLNLGVDVSKLRPLDAK